MNGLSMSCNVQCTMSTEHLRSLLSRLVFSNPSLPFVTPTARMGLRLRYSCQISIGRLKVHFVMLGELLETEGLYVTPSSVVDE